MQNSLIVMNFYKVIWETILMKIIVIISNCDLNFTQNIIIISLRINKFNYMYFYFV